MQMIRKNRNLSSLVGKKTRINDGLSQSSGKHAQVLSLRAIEKQNLRMPIPSPQNQRRISAPISEDASRRLKTTSV
jgi:hypothetical protein